MKRRQVIALSVGVGLALGLAGVLWLRRRVEGEATPAPTPEGEGAPADLVDIQGHKLRRDAAAAYERLRAAAQAAGFAPPLLNIVSGYRSEDTQAGLYQDALGKYRERLRTQLGREPTQAEVEAETRKWVAPPGHSAHQSGRAIDLYLGLPNDSKNAEAQRQLPVVKWLQAHMGEFGFAPYEAEPWHIVFKG